MSNLSKFNKVMRINGSLDNGLRLVSYSCLLTTQLLSMFGQASKYSHFVSMMTEIFNKITEARFINRIFATPLMVEWYKKASPGKEKLMALSMVLFFPLEHSWWLTTLNASINRYVELDGEFISQLSVRAWALYIVLDMQKQLEKLKIANTNSDKKEVLKAKIALRLCLCDSILALQYITGKRPFPDFVTTIAGAYGGYLGLKLKLLSI